jgi:hypothetical protein
MRDSDAAQLDQVRGAWTLWTWDDGQCVEQRIG